MSCRTAFLIVCSAALVGIVSSCVPPAEPGPDTVTLPASSVSVSLGTQQLSTVPVPGVARIDSIEPVGVIDALALIDVGDSTADDGTPAVALSVSADPGGSVRILQFEVRANACIEDSVEACPASSVRAIRAPITVSVTDPQIPADGGFVSPAENLLEVQPDGSESTSQFLEIASSPETDMAQISTAVRSAGGDLVGAVPELGAYQALFPSAAVGTAAIASLNASQPLVATPYQRGLDSETVEPAGDWEDDSDAVRWPFESTEVSSSSAGATPAWARSTGSRATVVGLIDSGIYREHEELRDQSSGGSDYIYRGTSRLIDLRGTTHGTHVAGTMCARANGIGLVGVMWDCRLRSLDIGNFRNWSTTELVGHIHEFLTRTAPRPRVFNMSYGRGCGSDHTMTDRTMYINLFRRFPDVLFVLAIGNCHGAFPNSPTVWGAWNAGPQNTLTVGASTSSRTLADFSTRAADVAAPGENIWSSVQSCHSLLLGGCTSQYAQMSGTSQAAPFVSGIAGLAMSAQPGLTVPDVRRCLSFHSGELYEAKNAAGQSGGYIVDGEAHLRCAVDGYKILFSSTRCKSFPCTTDIAASHLPANSPIEIRAVCREQDYASPQRFITTVDSQGNVNTTVTLQGDLSFYYDLGDQPTYRGCKVMMWQPGGSSYVRDALLPISE